MVFNSIDIRFITILYYLCFALIFVSCKTKQDTVNSFHEYSTSCITNNMDGVEVVIAFGKGKSSKEIEIFAIKSALHDLIFNGVRDGGGKCTNIPLLPSLNSENNHQKFFKEFFTSGGAFMKFASLKSNNQKKSSSTVNSFLIELKVEELKKYLEQFNIK